MAKPLDPPPVDNAPADAKSIPESKRAHMTLDTWSRLRSWLGLLRQTVRGIVNSGTTSAGTSIDGLPLSGWGLEGSDNLGSIIPCYAKLLAYSTSVQSIPNAVATTITTWSVSLSQGLSFNASTGVVTILQSGWYWCSGATQFASQAWNAGAAIIVYLSHNNAQVYTGQHRVLAAGTSFGCPPPVSGLIQCVAGDTIELQAFQNTGGASTLQGGGVPNMFLSITQVP